MKAHGLRGSTFENSINKTIEIYKNKKVALIQKIPTPITPVKLDKQHKQITLAYFDKKSTVDYIGVVQEIPICFDAKECSKNTFAMSNIHKHQFEFMSDFEEQGGVSFVLIQWTKLLKVSYLPFNKLKIFYERYKNKQKMSFHFDEIEEEYNIDIKNTDLVLFLDKLQLDLNERE